MCQFSELLSWRHFINSVKLCLWLILHYLDLLVNSANVLHELLSLFMWNHLLTAVTCQLSSMLKLKRRSQNSSWFWRQSLCLTCSAHRSLSVEPIDHRTDQSVWISICCRWMLTYSAVCACASCLALTTCRKLLRCSFYSNVINNNKLQMNYYTLINYLCSTKTQ